MVYNKINNKINNKMNNKMNNKILNEELKRIVELSLYDYTKKINTVNENKESIELDEVSRQTFRLLLGDIKGIAKNVKDFKMFGGDMVKAETFLTAAAQGRAAASELGLFTKEVLKGGSTLKSSKPGLFQSAAESYSKNLFNNTKDNIAKQFKNASEKDRIMLLKNQGYPEASINAINKEYKILEGGKVTPPPTGGIKNKPTDPTFTNKIKNFTKTKGEELKKLLKSGKNWKKILAWGLGLGISVPVLYWMVIDSGETIPQDLPTTPPIDSEWAPCIQNLINNKSGVVSVSPSGQISVLVTKTGNSEYDNAGGLKFYSNGRVWSSDNTKKGSWTCKGGEAQTNEMSLNEQTSTEIDSDVETMIDLLDFPVTSNDKQDALVMLKKYSTSPKGKEFLQSYKDAGVGGGSLKKSVSYITTTKASSARAKREMLGLISQIEGGKTTPTPTITPNPSTGGGIGGINITWDGEKTTEPVTPDVKSSEGTKKSSKFTDRDKFPYSFGHRGPIIKEVQICFGFPKKWQTGNFGPITLKKLQELYGTSEINEDTYKRIKEKCNPTSTSGTPAPTTPTTTTPTTTTPVPTPTSTTPTSTTPTSTTPTSTTKPISDEVKQEIRSNLKKRGIDGAYVYKGRDLTPDEQNYLIGYAKERGYEKFIPKEKMGPNDKYVFRKLKKK
jgi:hypothetical protein